MSSGLQVYTEVNKGQLNKTHQENPVSQNLALYTARKRIPRYPFVRNKKEKYIHDLPLPHISYGRTTCTLQEKERKKMH